MEKNITEDMLRCIVLCKECHEVCLRAISHCLQKGGRHAAPDHIRLLLDCSEICEISANFMLRGSAFHATTCGACAEVCERCAEDCDQLGDDGVMRRCADVCRRCAEACHRMAGELVAAEA